jgi:pyrroline-5-carboxylate reductase
MVTVYSEKYRRYYWSFQVSFLQILKELKEPNLIITSILLFQSSEGGNAHVVIVMPLTVDHPVKSSLKMNSQKISFIGGGNMANAIIGGLLTAGYIASNVIVSDPYEPTRQHLEKTFQVKTTTNNDDTIYAKNQVLILAVKPQVMKQVAEGIALKVQEFQPLIITIAAGITITDLSRWLKAGPNPKEPVLVRCMPNTPALVGEGATGVFAPSISQEQRQLASSVLQSISKSLFWVEKESLLDVVTGVSGSGPAYFFLLVEALEQAGVALGLPLDVARGLAAQTCMGAGKMLTTTTDTPSELRRKVTSPNGTTHAAIESFESNQFRDIVSKAVKAATDRGDELGKILGGSV